MLRAEEAASIARRPGSGAAPATKCSSHAQLRLIRPKTVERVAEARLPTEFGEFRIIGYRSLDSAEEFVALARGELGGEYTTLVRIHSQCLTGDVFGSTK